MENYSDYHPQQLSGKRVLVTGGTKGIGRATAIMLASVGAKVLLFGRNQKELDDTLESVSGKGFDIKGFTADVGKKEGIETVFKTVDNILGGIDILVNNAALAFQDVMDGGYDDWDYVVRTNLVGYFACAHEAIKRMKEQETGHIVLIGSMSAEVREKGSSIYVATKSGIEGFAAALRKEVNEFGIKITLIEPGATATNMQGDDSEALTQQTEKLEMLTADDVAASVVYALSQPKRSDVVMLQIRPHLQII